MILFRGPAERVGPPLTCLKGRKANKMTTQEKYITELLTPYFTGEEQFSTDSSGECIYLGDDGRMCVFSKACVSPKEFKDYCGDAEGVLSVYGKDVLSEKAKGMGFAPAEWVLIQGVHDEGAKNHTSESVINTMAGLSHIGPFKELRASIKEWHNKKASASAEARPS